MEKTNENLDQKKIEQGLVMAEMAMVFKKHRVAPMDSIEILGEMMMQVFVMFQSMTSEPVEEPACNFFERMKATALKVLAEKRKEKN